MSPKAYCRVVLVAELNEVRLLKAALEPIH